MITRDVNLPDHLDLIAAAPEGVRKLRGLILELAVRGKLVPQDPKDEPASELLKRIAQERERLEADGVCKRSKLLPPVGEDERPYSVPNGWAWTRLCDVVMDSSAGWSPSCESRPRTGNEWGVLKVSAVSWGSFAPDQNKALPAKLEPRPEHEVAAGDFLVSRANTAELVARSIFVEETPPYLMLSDKIVRLRLSSQVSGRYINIVNSACVARSYYARIAGGTSSSMKNVTREQILNLRTPLPPLAEQHRIVAKVGELMALCDQLEVEQTDSANAHARLVDTLLGTLTQSADAAELTANWQRLAEHFDTLFTTESSLDALKQTILQLAVMGKLVPQDPNDEPASELLKRIAQERARLEAEGARNRSKPVPPMREDEQPLGWESATLPELCVIGGGATPSKTKSAYWGKGFPWVSPKDMKVEYIFDSQDHVTELALSETRLPRIPAGSVLVVVRGMILLHSFPVAITQVAVAINQDMKSLTPVISDLQPFIALALRGFKRQILALVDRSTHGTCKLQSEKLFSFQFGIPPLAEQHRMVAKVDELLALCDRLKADLADSRARQARLSATLIESALAAA